MSRSKYSRKHRTATLQPRVSNGTPAKAGTSNISDGQRRLVYRLQADASYHRSDTETPSDLRRVVAVRKLSRSALTQAFRHIRFVVFDFDGVFTDNRVTVSQDGQESVTCCRSDGLGLKRLREVGVDMLIISTEVNPVVRVRAAKLGIKCVNGCEDKARELRAQVRLRGVALQETAFVGNDINDAGCLSIVGLPVLVGDAWPEMRSLAQLVLNRPGGFGAVREFCDIIWEARRRKSK